MSSNGNARRFSLEATQLGQRRSARALFGEDGGNRWEWQTATGVFTRDIADAQWKDLDSPLLALDRSEVDTVRRSQTQQATLTRFPVRAVARSSNQRTSGGKLRRLVRRVALMLS